MCDELRHPFFSLLAELVSVLLSFHLVLLELLGPLDPLGSEWAIELEMFALTLLGPQVLTSLLRIPYQPPRAAAS